MKRFVIIPILAAAFVMALALTACDRTTNQPILQGKACLGGYCLVPQVSATAPEPVPVTPQPEVSAVPAMILPAPPAIPPTIAALERRPAAIPPDILPTIEK